MARRVFLLGFMGCGKSSFGRRLSSELGWSFMDTDREIERRAGATVAEIFAERGEAAFRALESEVVADAAAAEFDTVVALGGGAVCREGAMETLSEAGATMYLKASPENLVRRLSAAGRAKRPKIAGMDDAELATYIEKTLPEREIYYNKATFVVDCDNASDEMIERLLVQHFNDRTVKQL